MGGASGENLWADGQSGHDDAPCPQIAGRLGIREKDPSCPGGKESRHHPGNEILLMEKERNPQESSPRKRGKCPISSKTDNYCGTHFEENHESFDERDRKLCDRQERPERPKFALARPSNPANRELIKFNPRVSRQHVRLEPVAAAYIHESRAWLSAP